MKSLSDPATKQSIADRVSLIRPHAAPRWGRMSAHQMICHLSDSWRAALGEKSVSPATGLFQRTLMKWGALYIPIEWPKEVQTRPEMDQTKGGTPPGDFEQDRAVLLNLTDRFCASNPGFAHPIFGVLTDSERLRWGYLHMDHHLRQFGV
jgi:hypothetical protein